MTASYPASDMSSTLSSTLMPALLILTILLSIFVVTRPGAGAGVAYYLKPDFSKLSMMTVLAALGQLFFSMSLAMGIMITYGSYLRKQDHIEQSVRQIEVFDTLVVEGVDRGFTPVNFC